MTLSEAIAYIERFAATADTSCELDILAMSLWPLLFSTADLRRAALEAAWSTHGLEITHVLKTHAAEIHQLEADLKIDKTAQETFKHANE